MQNLMSLRLVTKSTRFDDDADVDGGHDSKAACLTLIYRYMKPILEAGYIYIAQPPIYGVKVEVRSKELHSTWCESEIKLKKP